MGSIGASQNTSTKVDRPIDENINRRTLKLHVSKALNEAGFQRAVTVSGRIVRTVAKSGWDWRDDYDGRVYITHLKPWSSTASSDEYFDRVVKTLEDRFSVERRVDSVYILGEYKKEK